MSNFLLYQNIRRSDRRQGDMSLYFTIIIYYAIRSSAENLKSVSLDIISYNFESVKSNQFKGKHL